MVQVVRNNPRRQSLGANLGSMLGEGLSSLANIKMQELAQQKQQQAKLKGLSALPGIQPEQVQALSHLPDQLLGPIVKQYMTQGQNRAFIEEIAGRSGGRSMQGEMIDTPQGEIGAVQETQRGPQGQPQGFDALEFIKKGATPQQALSLGKFDQGERKLANQEQDLKFRQDIASRKLDIQEADRRAKLTNEVQDAADRGNSFKEAAEIIGELGREGKIDDPKYLAALEFFGVDKDFFKSDATVLANSLLKNFQVGFTELFGARPNETEFKVFQKMLPNLTQTVEGRQKILDYFSYLGDLATKRSDDYYDLLKKYKGKRLPLNLDEKVNKRANKYRKEAFNKFKELATSIGGDDKELKVGETYQSSDNFPVGARFRDNSRVYEKTATGRKLIKE